MLQEWWASLREAAPKPDWMAANTSVSFSRLQLGDVRMLDCSQGSTLNLFPRSTCGLVQVKILKAHKEKSAVNIVSVTHGLLANICVIFYTVCAYFKLNNYSLSITYMFNMPESVFI